MTKTATAPRHNDMRFDISMAHIFPMIEAGEVNMSDLIAKVRAAITDAIDRETDWQQYQGGCFVRSTGGDGQRDEPLHDEVIVYDFS